MTDFIEDFLVAQNLMTRYPGYAERLRCLLTVSHSHSSDIVFASHSRVFLSHLKSLCCRNELSPESISEAASNNGFSLKQILLILRVQRRVINKSRTKVLRKTHDFQDEKSNDKSKNRGKLSFQEQVLIQVKILVRHALAHASLKEFDCSIKRVHSKSGGVMLTYADVCWRMLTYADYTCSVCTPNQEGWLQGESIRLNPALAPKSINLQASSAEGILTGGGKLTMQTPKKS